MLSVVEYFVDLRVRLADISIDWAIGGTREILSRDPRTRSLRAFYAQAND